LGGYIDRVSPIAGGEHGDIGDAVAVHSDDIEHDGVDFPGRWPVDDKSTAPPRCEPRPGRRMFFVGTCHGVVTLMTFKRMR
jgi:hypothetical protein